MSTNWGEALDQGGLGLSGQARRGGQVKPKVGPTPKKNVITKCVRDAMANYVQAASTKKVLENLPRKFVKSRPRGPSPPISI